MSCAALLLSLALLLPIQSAPAAPAPPASTAGVEVTYLANAGFYLRSGKTAVLIDACLREPVGLHAALPGPVHGQLTNAKPPFDQSALVLVSHEHSDHVQPRVLEKLLTNNLGARLMSSPQVVERLRAGAQDYEAIRGRVATVQPVLGKIHAHAEEGLTVGFFRLEHSGKGHQLLEHFGHLIELGGVRILHVGDAEPRPGNFAAYDLDSKAIDVAIVPYWFYGSASGAQALREQIAARTVIVSHVPPTKWAELDQLLTAQFPEVVLFKDPLEKRTFAPAQPLPARDSGVADGDGG